MAQADAILLHDSAEVVERAGAHIKMLKGASFKENLPFLAHCRELSYLDGT